MALRPRSLWVSVSPVSPVAVGAALAWSRERRLDALLLLAALALLGRSPWLLLPLALLLVTALLLSGRSRP